MILIKDLEKLTAKKDDKQIAGMIEQLFDVQQDITRIILDRITYRNILYYIGEQYVEFVKSAGTFRRRLLPAYIPTPYSNQIKDYIRSLKAMLLNQKLIPKVSPNTTEPEDRQAADLGGKLLEWMDTINEGEFSDEKEKLAVWVGLSGTGFLRTYPDMDSGKWFMGKEGLMKTGEVITRAIVPLSVRFDYSGATLKQKRWVGVQTLVPREYVEDMFKVKISGPSSPDVIDYERKLMKLVSQVSPWKGAGLETQVYQEDQDWVLLREMELRPTPKYSKGRYILACHQEVLIDANRMPIKVKEDDWHYTLTDFHADYVPGRFWSDAPVNDLISPQNGINEILQLLALNRKGLGRPRIISPGDIKLESIQEGGHAFLALKYDALLAGGQKPEMSPGISLPPQTLAEFELHKASIQDASGDPKSILKGKPPSASSSGVQVDILRETAERGHYPDLERYNRSMARVYKKRLLLASEIYSEKRQIKIMGRGHAMDIVSFKAANLRDNTDVRLELDSGLSTTKAGQTQLLMQLAEKGLFGPVEANPELREEFLDRLGLSGSTSQANVDIERAETENAAVSSGKPQNLFLMDPDKIGEDGTPEVANLDPLFKYDNHPIHYEIHRRFILTSTFAELPQQAQIILLAHADAHETVMQTMMAAQASVVQGEEGQPQGKPGGGEKKPKGPGENINPMETQESEFTGQGG